MTRASRAAGTHPVLNADAPEIGLRKPIGRRSFLWSSAGAVLGWTAGRRGKVIAAEPASRPGIEARPVTHGPRHHFFGYYDKPPWNQSGQYLLAMEIGFYERQPEPSELLTIGMVDLKKGDRFIPLDQTSAWCWQQGTMLQWLGSNPESEVIYNSVAEGHYVSVVRDIHNGQLRALPRPVYAVSGDGIQALSLDFSRLGRLRPGYGYVSIPDTTEKVAAPDDTGIFRMDIRTGRSELILSLAWAAAHQVDKRFDGAHHWFNHLTFNPSGTRFVFLHRWTRPNGSWYTRLYTARSDGTEVHLLSDSGMVSHYAWRDDEHILAWSRSPQGRDRFHLFDDQTGKVEVIGEGILTRDGHCTYSPDGRWILLDSYPDKQQMQKLMLYRATDGRLVEIGQFHHPPKLAGQPYRCDLHPRWDRKGRQVCIDSARGETRQMYVIDVAEVTRT